MHVVEIIIIFNVHVLIAIMGMTEWFLPQNQLTPLIIIKIHNHHSSIKNIVINNKATKFLAQLMKVVPT